jgi:hypothetical protein
MSMQLRAHGNWNNVPVQSTFAEWLYARHWPMHTPSTFPELWACQFCSFSNDYTLKHCAICQMPAKSTVELKAMLADDLRKEVLMREADRYGIDMLCEFDPADEFSESSEAQTSSEEEEEEEEDELGDEVRACLCVCVCLCMCMWLQKAISMRVSILFCLSHVTHTLYHTHTHSRTTDKHAK